MAMSIYNLLPMGEGSCSQDTQLLNQHSVVSVVIDWNRTAVHLQGKELEGLYYVVLSSHEGLRDYRGETLHINNYMCNYLFCIIQQLACVPVPAQLLDVYSIDWERRASESVREPITNSIVVVVW
jgi:hypothetical protein